jgi:protein phosphatase
MDQHLDESSNRLLLGIQLANARIRHAARQDDNRKGMGSTVVAAQVIGRQAYFAWVGDSRGYLFRRGELLPMTSDHSLLNELLESGALRPDDAASFPHKNVLTRALGLTDRALVDLRPVALEDGDIVLVCCDGLTGMLDDQSICQHLQNEPVLDEACRELISSANEAGGFDNITVALARYRADR